MSTSKHTAWLRVLLIVVGSFVLLVGAVIGGAVWWFRANEGRLREQGLKITAEAQAFAKDHAQAECVDETLRRGMPCDGLICEGSMGVFGAECLRRAQPTPDLCNGVPAQSEVWKASMWSLDECNRRGHNGSQRCSRLVKPVMDVCHQPTSTK